MIISTRISIFSFYVFRMIYRIRLESELVISGRLCALSSFVNPVVVNPARFLVFEKSDFLKKMSVDVRGCQMSLCQKSFFWSLIKVFWCTVDISRTCSSQAKKNSWHIQIARTFDLADMPLCDSASVVVLLCRPLIDVHRGVGGASVQHNPVLETKEGVPVRCAPGPRRIASSTVTFAHDISDMMFDIFLFPDTHLLSDDSRPFDHAGTLASSASHDRKCKWWMDITDAVWSCLATTPVQTVEKESLKQLYKWLNPRHDIPGRRYHKVKLL